MRSTWQRLGFSRLEYDGNQLLPAGYNFVQLEVRASNEGAISFYRKRGLEIVQELHGYYRQGLGYMMRGQLRHHHPNNDTP